jgi:hypothetical protein
MKIARRSNKTISMDSVIYSLRGEKVILDADLARLYGVTTKRLNEQVKRNVRRFPADSAFRLSEVERELLNGTNCEIRQHGQPVANCDRFPEAP